MDVPNSTWDNRMGWIVLAGFHSGKLYAVGGQEMCGFHWQPQKIMKVDVSAKTAESVDVSAGGRPPFAFSGPSSNVQLKDGRWILLGGSLARGMSDTEFSRDIWMMDLAAENLGWKKLEMQLPNEIKEYELCSATNGERAFVCDTNHCFALQL